MAQCFCSGKQSPCRWIKKLTHLPRCRSSLTNLSCFSLSQTELTTVFLWVLPVACPHFSNLRSPAGPVVQRTVEGSWHFIARTHPCLLHKHLFIYSGYIASSVGVDHPPSLDPLQCQIHGKWLFQRRMYIRKLGSQLSWVKLDTSTGIINENQSQPPPQRLFPFQCNFQARGRWQTCNCS